MADKERIIPPNKRELHDASKQTRKGHPSGARTMADASVAKREGVKRPHRSSSRSSGRH